MGATFEYIIGNRGVQAASTYPLLDVQYPCKFNYTRMKTSIAAYGYILGDEETLKRALASIGPLSVGVNGGIDSFYNYWSGVYDDPACNGDLNHAMTLIGYVKSCH